MDALMTLLTTVLRMSAWGTVAALGAAICWLVLRRLRCSKTVLLLMWLVVGFRLLCPWSPASALSLFNLTWPDEWVYPAYLAEVIERPYYVGQFRAEPEGSEDFDRAVSAGILPEATEDGSTTVFYVQDNEGAYHAPTTARETIGAALAVLWPAGMAAMLGYGAASCLRLKKRLRFAVRDEQDPDVWYSDRIPSPCVVGLFRPKIYLTFGLTGAQREHILAHERAHVKNGDHWWKFLAWLILSMHWFNLFLWGFYRFFVLCLEEACDQRVLRRLGQEHRADYSQALLDLATGRALRPGPSPIAFGEGDAGQRVKSALRYRPPVALLTAAALVIVAALGLFLGTSASEKAPGSNGESFEIVELNDWWALSSLSVGAARDEMLGGQVQIAPDRFSVQDKPDASPVVYDHPTYQELDLGNILPLFYRDGTAVPEAGQLDLSAYQQAQGWQVYDQQGNDTGYSIYVLDGQLFLVRWISHGTGGTITQVYYRAELAPAGSLQQETVSWTYTPQLSSRYPVFPLTFDLDYDRVEASCQTGELIGYDDYDEASGGYPTGQSLTLPAGSRLYWGPLWQADGEIQTASCGTVHFTLYRGEEAVLSGALLLTASDAAEPGGTVYSVRATLSNGAAYTFVSDGEGGLIRPVE